MDQRIVKLQIANEFIVGSGVSIGAVGSHDDVLLEMDFRSSAPWAGTTRRAIFSNALGENRTPIILTTNLLAEGQADVYLVPVPAEAKDVAGDCFLTVEGFISEGEREILRIVTEEATFRVLPSKLYHNENPSLTPTELEQLQAEIDDVKKDIVKAAQASVALDKTLEAQAKAEEAAEAAHDAQEAVENLSVTGENVPADSDTPIIEKQVNEDGSVTLHFNTRQGVSGVYVGDGDMPDGYDVQVNPEGEGLSIEDLIREAMRSAIKIGEVSLLASAWVGDKNPYSQVVEIDGVTEHSQVDLTPSVEQLAIFHNKDLAFVTENEDGVVTVYAIGQKPENDYIIQVTITEVAV